MKKIIPLLILSILLISFVYAADNYLVYSNWDTQKNYITGVDGFVDRNNKLERGVGKEYIFFTDGPGYGGSHTAYVYEIITTCSGSNNQGDIKDPNTHPDNPDNTGTMCGRNFIPIPSLTHYMGSYASGHDNAFYISDDGIYYGGSNKPKDGYKGWYKSTGDGSPGKLNCGIYQWGFDWNPIGCAVSKAGNFQDTAYDSINDNWWAGDGNRKMYRFESGNWVYKFKYANLGGGHFDGMEIIGDSLFVSDMTSDHILQYKINDQGNAIDKDGNVLNGNIALGKEFEHYTYSNPQSVEVMGHGPNNHIWVSGWSSGMIYELGGNELQCSITEEICDGIDNNCDGLVDLDDPAIVMELCSLQDSICANSYKTCSGTAGWQDCTAADYLNHNPNYEVNEISCDGIDNDCDNLIDEEQVCCGNYQVEDLSSLPLNKDSPDEVCDGPHDQQAQCGFLETCDMLNSAQGDSDDEICQCDSIAEICDDTNDNDGDGLIDCDDPDCCSDPLSCPEYAYNEGSNNGLCCFNNRDDDVDGTTDENDLDCVSISSCLAEGHTCCETGQGTEYSSLHGSCPNDLECWSSCSYPFDTCDNQGHECCNSGMGQGVDYPIYDFSCDPGQNCFDSCSTPPQTCNNQGHECCVIGTGQNTHYGSYDSTCNSGEQCFDSCSTVVDTCNSLGHLCCPENQGQAPAYPSYDSTCNANQECFDSCTIGTTTCVIEGFSCCDPVNGGGTHQINHDSTCNTGEQCYNYCEQQNQICLDGTGKKCCQPGLGSGIAYPDLDFSCGPDYECHDDCTSNGFNGGVSCDSRNAVFSVLIISFVVGFVPTLREGSKSLSISSLK